MNFSQVTVLMMVCVLGLMVTGNLAQYGSYNPYYGNSGASGGTGSSFLVLIGLLFVILFLFSGFSRSNTGTSTIMVANLSG